MHIYTIQIKKQQVFLFIETINIDLTFNVFVFVVPLIKREKWKNLWF